MSKTELTIFEGDALMEEVAFRPVRERVRAAWLECPTVSRAAALTMIRAAMLAVVTEELGTGGA